MVEIRPIATCGLDTLRRISSGYTSNERYDVRKRETSDHIRFDIDLVELSEPYVKVWDWSDEDQTLYDSILRKGLSIAAYDGEEMVGLAIADPQDWGRILNVYELHVAEHARGRGIGRALVERLKASARGRRLRAIVCETQNTNVPAIRFYRAVGFELDAVDLSFYTNNDVDNFEVAFFMKLKLDSSDSARTDS